MGHFTVRVLVLLAADEPPFDLPQQGCPVAAVENLRLDGGAGDLSRLLISLTARAGSVARSTDRAAAHPRDVRTLFAAHRLDRRYPVRRRQRAGIVPSGARLRDGETFPGRESRRLEPVHPAGGHRGHLDQRPGGQRRTPSRRPGSGLRCPVAGDVGRRGRAKADRSRAGDFPARHCMGTGGLRDSSTLRLKATLAGAGPRGSERPTARHALPERPARLYLVTATACGQGCHQHSIRHAIPVCHAHCFKN